VNYSGQLILIPDPELSAFAKSVLETGVRQPEAIRFYTKLGCDKIDNYRQYIGNSNSICMSKELRKWEGEA